MRVLYGASSSTVTAACGNLWLCVQCVYSYTCGLSVSLCPCVCQILCARVCIRICTNCAENYIYSAKMVGNFI